MTLKLSKVNYVSKNQECKARLLAHYLLLVAASMCLAATQILGRISIRYESGNNFLGHRQYAHSNGRSWSIAHCLFAKVYCSVVSDDTLNWAEFASPFPIC